MFKCEECGSTEFRLIVHPDFQEQVEVTTTEESDVIIRAGSQEFVADLMFMNQFAVCSRCEATKKWAYYYPDKSAT